MVGQQDKGDPIRVLIVDDHAIVRHGLTSFLSACEGLEMVGQASDGQQAVALCERHYPDVVLMDMVMPGMDGPAATRIIVERWPDIKVIALTSFDDRGLVRLALQSGASGYLLKNVTADQIACAVVAAMAGQAPLAAEAQRALVDDAAREPVPGAGLTPREREVLALLAAGMRNEEIASRLTLETSTVRFHVSSILSKLQATNRTEAAMIAVKHGLVEAALR